MTIGLSDIYNVTKLIYAQAKLVQGNEKQCDRLVERIKAIETAIAGLDNIKDTDNYQLNLKNFVEVLNNCLIFIREFNQSNCFQRWILEASSYKEKFDKLNQCLQQSATYLNLGMVAQQIINHEQDKADQEADSAHLIEIVSFSKQNLAAVQALGLQLEQQQISLNAQMEKMQSQLQDVHFSLSSAASSSTTPVFNVDAWRKQLYADFKDDLALYIPVRGDFTAECTHPKPMEEHVQEFLQSPAKVLLVLGGSGSGKTLFGQYLAHKIVYSPEKQHFTPLWMSLSGLKNPQQNAIKEALLLQGVPEDQLDSFRKIPLLLIFDGYDEVKDLGNLYESNYIKQWNAKVIISCRSEYLATKNYNLLFKPESGLFWECYIAPFTSAEIAAYLQKFIELKLEKHHWSVEKYQSEIEKLPRVKELIETPFLLRIVAEVLPAIVEAHQDKSEPLTLTRRALYEKFMEQWFERHLLHWGKPEQNKLLLLDEGLNLDKDAEEFERNEKRMGVLQHYAETFAHRLHSAHLDAVSMKATEQYPWVQALFDRSPRSKLIRSACPLKKTGEDTYGFIHKSLWEYLVTLRMVQEMQPQSATSSLVFGASNSSSSTLHSESTLMSIEHLNQQLLSPEIVQFLVDAITEKPALQAAFWSVIDSSKHNSSRAIAASNAATVLNAARISFSGRDLSHTHLQGADLSGGIFDNTNFEGANLTNVTLAGAWLHGTDFTNSQMREVKFSEHPSILTGNSVVSCCYSTDGKYLAIGMATVVQRYDGKGNNNVLLYKADTNKLLHTFEGHRSDIRSVCFRPNKNELASGSEDYTIKLWSIDTGDMIKRLEHHHNYVNSIDYNWDGTTLASGSGDKTIKLWDPNNGELKTTLTGHTDSVTRVKFSPDKKLLASCSSDKTIKLWLFESKNLYKTLKDEHYWLRRHAISIDFNFEGNLLASGDQGTIKIWSVNDGVIIKELNSHTNLVSCVHFIQKGGLLLSCGSDTAVQLWSIDSGNLIKTFQHAEQVYCVDFNVSRNILAVGCSRSVKFWPLDDKNFALQQKTFGYRSDITGIHLSQDGKLLAASWGRTIELWSVTNRKLLKTIHCDTRFVCCVQFSPDSKLLASGGEANVMLWRVNGELDRTLNVAPLGHLVHSISFTLDGTLFVSASEAVKLWSTKQYELLSTIYSEPHNTALSAHFSKNGMYLAVGFYDKKIRIFAIEDRTLFRTFEGHTSSIISVQFSLNGKWLASTSSNKQVKLWSLETFSLQETLISSKNTLEYHYDSLKFNSESSCLFLADRMLEIWDLSQDYKSTTSIKTQIPYEAKSISICKNNSNTYLASGHSDGNIYYWKLTYVNNSPYLQLLWSTHQSILLLQEANIDRVQGLSKNNIQLLRERGAIGKPFIQNNIVENISNANNNASSNSQQARSQLQQQNTVAIPLMLSDAGKSASGSNNKASSSSQSNNNAQHKSETSSVTKNLGESSNHGAEEDKKGCKIM